MGCLSTNLAHCFMSLSTDSTCKHYSVPVYIVRAMLQFPLRENKFITEQLSISYCYELLIFSETKIMVDISYGLCSLLSSHHGQ